MWKLSRLRSDESSGSLYDFVPPGHITPIPMDELISSLSAILLDEDYYQFVLSGRKIKHGMPSWVGEDRLIPLKAIAWMEMNARVLQGETIDSRKITKHLSDIVQLSALFAPSHSIELPEKIKTDLHAFIKAVAAMNRPELVKAMHSIAKAYAIGNVD